MVKIHSVGPNKAVFVTGGFGSKNKKMVVGGWVFAVPFISKTDYLQLNLMTLKPICNDVETLQGVPLNVSAIAQCKIMNSNEFLLIAAEHFLGKPRREIESAILQTLEGHLRAILGTLTVEETYRDRKKFASLVREVAATDVAKMGIQIVSFVIKDITDNVGYLAALGKAQTAAVKRDANIGIAHANRDAGIREAECERECNEVLCKTLTSIENHGRIHRLQKASFDTEINTAKAEAQLAYQLAEAKIRQQIRLEEIGIDIIIRKKYTEIEQKEIERKECELMSTVRLPTEAETYRLETIAQGMKTEVMQNAIAEGERIKRIGEAEANIIKLIGLSEAKKMSLKALAYQQYGDAAIKNLILQKLPEIASKISSPLSKIEEIVLLGGNNNLVGDLNTLAGQIPPAINALSGVDIKKVIGKDKF